MITLSILSGKIPNDWEDVLKKTFFEKLDKILAELTVIITISIFNSPKISELIIQNEYKFNIIFKIHEGNNISGYY